jgi:hypothetical protein
LNGFIDLPKTNEAIFSSFPSAKNWVKSRNPFLTAHFLSMYKVKGNSSNNLRGLVSYRVATPKKEYTYLIIRAWRGQLK